MAFFDENEDFELGPELESGVFVGGMSDGKSVSVLIGGWRATAGEDGEFF